MSNSYQEMLLQMAEQDRLETEAYEAFIQRAEALIHDAELIWRWGDGHGGWLKAEFESLVNRIVPQKPTSKPKPKIGYALRREVFERDGYCCRHCGTHLNLCASQIDRTGEIELDNFKTLCRACIRAGVNHGNH